MPIIIRPAVAADQPAIKAIVRAARIYPIDLRWPQFLVAEDAARVVGIGQVKPHGDGSRELASIAVVPDQQRKAIAKLIIRALLAREPGTLYLTCQESMQGYYARFGFRPVPPRQMTPYVRRLRRIAQLIRLIVPGIPRMAVMKRGGEGYV
jgi:N-acetylglutamate synthase-like GNAT family acetyltransferase